jgi:hypothetical protein
LTSRTSFFVIGTGALDVIADRFAFAHIGNNGVGGQADHRPFLPLFARALR